MNVVKLGVGVSTVSIHLLLATPFAADVTRDDVAVWLGQTVVVDAPVAGTTVGIDDLASLKPWIPPG